MAKIKINREKERQKRQQEELAFALRLNQMLDEYVIGERVDRKTKETVKEFFPKKGYGRQTLLAEYMQNKFRPTFSQNAARGLLEKGKGAQHTKVALAEIFGCRKEWLMFDLGPMWPHDSQTNKGLLQRITSAVEASNLGLTKGQRMELIEKLYQQLS